MSSGDQIVDPMQDRVNATMRLARLVAGDDEARYVQAFHTIYNAADQPAIQGDGRPEAAGAARAEGAPTRTRNVPGAPEIPVDSVFSDPLYLANAQWLMKTRVRVVGGVPTTGFEDCVAVGTATAWCCTATLVATAPAVAVAIGCSSAGTSTRVPRGRRTRSATGKPTRATDRRELRTTSRSSCSIGRSRASPHAPSRPPARSGARGAGASSGTATPTPMGQRGMASGAWSTSRWRRAPPESCWYRPA